MNNQPETLKPKMLNTGKIGLILSSALLAVSLLLFMPPVLTLFVFLVLPLLLFSLLMLLSFFFSIHGLIKSRGRMLAIGCFLVNFLTIGVLFFVFLTFTPSGSIPPPLNIYKFKRACPEAAFWLDFGKFHTISIKSQNTILFNKLGAIFLYTKDYPYYQPDTIIEYAEKNNWKYYCSFPLYQEDFDKFDTKAENIEIEDDDPLSEVLDLLYRSPIILKQDCIVLVFETDSPLGYPSYIFISKDQQSLVIFYQNPVLPDSYTNYWFSICADLSEKRSEEIELRP